MSVDPIAATGTSGFAALDALDALVAAELSALAADAQALQQQVVVGDIVSASVLPPNGLGDVVSILGNRVAASLPPALTPGDVITVQVTGFNGSQIQLQILGNPASGAALPATPAGGGAPPLPGSDPGRVVSAPPRAAVPLPATSVPGIAPPPSVFVAASVRPNAPVPSPVAPGVAIDEPEALTKAAASAIPGAAGATPGGTGDATVPALLGGIEARLAAARAAAVTIVVPAPAGPPQPAAPPPAPASGTATNRQPPVPAAEAAAVPAPPAARLAIPPPLVAARPAEAGATATTGSAPAAPVPPRTIASFQDPVALVRALRLPVTPSNIAAATLAIQTPQRLPAALATLQSALPASDDPHVQTLQTLAAFVGKISPASPVLAEQIAAYVDHIVVGSEATLSSLLSLQQEAGSAPVPVTAVAVARPPADEATAAETVRPSTAEGTLPVAALAQIAERGANLAASLKEQLFALITGSPPSGPGSDALVPAASTALTAVTSMQMIASQALAASPQTVSFAIPMWLGGGTYAQAQIAVDRDRPDAPAAPLDGDNFHIAFILETKNLGTVAIDVRTVGRTFALSVKTETLRTAQRFGDELSRLTDRLSSLRYEPASVEAVVAPAASERSDVPRPTVVTDDPERADAAGVNARG